MYPAPFHYHRPQTLNDAIILLAELGEGAKPLAGGQTLIPILKMRMDEPTDLVDIARLPGLRLIHDDTNYIHIGALATHAQIANSAVAAEIPVIHDCASGIADPQVRSQGTIGGSLGAADPSSDWPSLLHTLDTEIICQGTNGVRLVPVRDFVTDSYTTVLRNSELITGVRIKKPGKNNGGAYIGFKKAAPAYPAAAVGIQLSLSDDDICEDIRIVLSAVGPRPVISEEAEAELRGKSISTYTLTRSAEAIISCSSPPTDARGTASFKRAMLHNLFMRAAKIAVNRARGSQAEGTHDYV